MDVSLKYLWGVINMAQLIEFLLIVCVPKPFNVSMTLQALSVANGDFKFLEFIDEKILNDLVVSYEGEYVKSQNSCFESAGFE